MGRFLLVYIGDYSGSECLSIYGQRDAIEKAFCPLKTDLDIFPLRNLPSAASSLSFSYP